MKFLDLFSGIGGFRLGMEAAGHKCVGFCEIDKFARASYKAIYNTKGEVELHDITEVSDEFIRGIGRVDVICGGFPCQAFSVAGKRGGFNDTRGTLFFEVARFASILKPKYLFLENVKGLLNHDKGRTFATILNTLDELGYDAEWQVLNSKDFGVPQNRERVFIIGHLRGAGGRPVFPLRPTIGTNEGQSRKILKVGNVRKMGKSQSGDVVAVNGLAPTLCSSTTQKDALKIAIPVSPSEVPDDFKPKIIQIGRGFNKGGIHDISPTLTKNSWENNNFLMYDALIRRVTPRECWRLQGFPDWAFDKAQEVNSNSQLYKQAGNSVTVNVIAAIAERL